MEHKEMVIDIEKTIKRDLIKCSYCRVFTVSNDGELIPHTMLGTSVQCKGSSKC